MGSICAACCSNGLKSSIKIGSRGALDDHFKNKTANGVTLYLDLTILSTNRLAAHFKILYGEAVMSGLSIKNKNNVQ